MNEKIVKGNIPVYSWADVIQPEVLDQVLHLADHPFAFHHVALMPDCHKGFGMPIGAVLAVDGCVIPNAVGVDIGCGMFAMKTNCKKILQIELQDIIDQIKQEIPLGHKHHKAPQAEALMPSKSKLKPHFVAYREYDAARLQLGTLGGGNHFIEIQKDMDGFIWIMIHSGSRNIGLRVAEHYQKIAKQKSKDANYNIPTEWQLDVLFLKENVGIDYWTEMNFCVEFAFANRKHMAAKTFEIFNKVNRTKFEIVEFINIAHNYAAIETHFGKEVIVHRKGATSATKGEKGIIPGSQGSQSYIVEGLGNPHSFNSCSHGAGRVMGRREAQRKLELEQEIRNLNEKGIIHSISLQKHLDEAPSAYKNIEEVMKNQQDLVLKRVTLEPMAVVKG